MPSSSYQTDIQTMATAAQKVDAVNQQITGRLTQLRGQIQSLQGLWKGGAYSSFQSLMDRWDTDAKKLSQALQGIGEGLKGNQQNYQVAEDNNQSSFTQISNRLG
jgi:WXG100 family type VII secretion target